MLQYPLLFRVQAQANAGISTPWNVNVTSPSHQIRSVTCSIPPEFAGPGEGLSPEDLYAMALLNCFIATFKVMAEHSKVKYSSLGGQAVLEVDRNSDGVPWMARLRIAIRLSGAENVEKTERVLQKAAKASMILNSVKTEITVDFTVETNSRSDLTDPTLPKAPA